MHTKGESQATDQDFLKGNMLLRAFWVLGCSRRPGALCSDPQEIPLL